MPENVDARYIESLIKEFVDHSETNSLKSSTDEPAFGSPLVGFANGADPLFELYKEHVGPFHMTPREIFALTFRDLETKPEQLTVISYILPHTKATKSDNRRETFYPSERWARARIFGEEVNIALRKHLAEKLTEAGCRAVAPSLTPQFSMRISPKYGFSSTWSERHAAHAAGLGTFGLCDGLITPVGKAMRTGSVVARIQIPATPRPYSDHREYCLFYTDGTCKKCMARCPVGAVTEAGKNKEACLRHLFPATSEYVRKTYGFEGYGCGLCQTGIPCESRIPLYS